MHADSTQPSRSVLGPILTQGFAAAVGLWCAWYATHIPWLGLAEEVRIPILLTVWLGMCTWAGMAAPARPALVGAGAGLIAAVVGLLLLGTRLAPGAAPAAGDSHPQVALLSIGFLAAGGVIGLIGGTVGGVVGGGGGRRRDVDWLGRFALIATASVAPLVFIGGLVTSTNSGMAVPDWPNTYGSNMFLYPLGPRVGPDVFFEHSHRLFGTLVGLTTLVLMLWTLLAESRRWLKVFSVCVFLLVVLQGILGGIRVRLGSTNPAQDLRIFAMAHGILAQLTFGCVIAIAVYLSPTFKRGAPAGYEPHKIPGLRRLKTFATGALHSTILQLIFGAAYRHFRDPHSMWSHAGFSMVVLIMALISGFAAGAIPDEATGISRIIRRCGTLVLVVVILQFLLGWATFSVGGSGLTADSPAQALLRTVHQANGALVLAAIATEFLWTRRLLRLNRVPAP